MQKAQVGGVVLFPRSRYAGELRASLPEAAFAPSRSRLALPVIYGAVITVAFIALARHWVPTVVFPVVSIVIGVLFGSLTFVAHDALHGGITRNKALQHVVGWIGFLPFLVSPRLWVAWHNRTHHAETNLPDDPDAYPTLERYRGSAAARFAIDAFSLGGSRIRGGLSLILGFTVQSASQLVLARGRFLDARQHKLALLESGLGLAVWASVAVVVGFVPFVFGFVLPLLVGNVCVMAFILTNHSLSPRGEINDPLISGLSVTTPPVIEWITLGFGLHVEHHLFPAMSSRHAHLVRALVQARWPERYQSMPLGEALLRLHRTARVYKDDTTLIDPTTGIEYPTLMPRTSPPVVREPRPQLVPLATPAIAIG